LDRSLLLLSSTGKLSPTRLLNNGSERSSYIKVIVHISFLMAVLICNFNEVMKSSDIEAKKRLLHSIVESVFWDDGNLEINLFYSKKKQ